MANLKAEVTLEWGDDQYLFALKASQIEELEKLCDEGIGRIAARVFSRVDFSYKHVRETIRLGLIGGGMPAVEASRLTKTYVDGVPMDAVYDPSSTVKTASAILQAVYFGWEDLPAATSGEPVSPEPKQTSGSTGRRRGERASTRTQSEK